VNALGAVNRVLRAGGILRGDTDAITTFSDLQHGATIQMALLAIQDELTELVSDTLIPYEKKTTGSIVTVAGTRSYALASDFVRFFGTAKLYNSTDNRELFEFSGGEDKLSLMVHDYKTVQGDPSAWYFEAGTTKQISLYQVPNAIKTYAYDYEYDVSVTNSTDTLPFTNEIEAQTFCRLASRRFKYLYEGMDVAGLDTDTERMKAKATLANLLTGKNAPKSYAPVYR
jgi:hypothetical protein